MIRSSNCGRCLLEVGRQASKQRGYVKPDGFRCMYSGLTSLLFSYVAFPSTPSLMSPIALVSLSEGTLLPADSASPSHLEPPYEGTTNDLMSMKPGRDGGPFPSSEHPVSERSLAASGVSG